ncbi:MFS transporter [Caulobacter sp. S45]|uniref:MFS transporter n=1 Tax=Caulobacter sp. S45 TaxID=1641861 RepID=UPI002110D8DE|nr:MFS transporter [Caulobacter sp. S45]
MSGDLWRKPAFMKLWSAQAISEFGARFARDGLPLAAVLVLHGSPHQVGLIAALAILPRIVIGTLAGGYIDRSNRRWVMIGADVMRALLLATIPLAAVFHVLSILQLYGVAFLVGAGSVVFDIANQAYVPALVDREHLLEGNTKLSVTASLANVSGPAVTGLLIQLVTAPFAVGLTSISYGVSAILLAWMRHTERPNRVEAKGWLVDFRDGCSAVFGERIIGPICLMETSANLFVAMFASLYPFIALRELHLTPFMFGATFAAGGAGALCGAWLRPWLTRRLGIGPASILAIFVAGAATFVFPLTYGPPVMAAILLGAAQFVGDALSTVSGITINTLRQSAFETDRLGRVNSVFQVTVGAASLVGALAGGWLGEALGARQALLIAAAGLTGSTLWAFLSPLPGLRHAPGPTLSRGWPSARM